MSVTLAMWLASLEHAGAQPLDDDATTRERWGCLAEIRPAITELDPAEHPMAVACARVGGLRIGGSVELIAFDEGGDEGNHRDGDDVRLHVVTPDADRVFTLDAERQRFRQPSLGWIDDLEVQVHAVQGAPQLVRISVVSRAGEDYFAGEETSVIVDPRHGLDVVWAGPGDYAQRDYFVCYRSRTTTVRVRGGVLHVRSRISHHVAPMAEGDDPATHAQLAAECASPPRVRVDLRIARRPSSRATAPAPEARTAE